MLVTVMLEVQMNGGVCPVKTIDSTIEVSVVVMSTDVVEELVYVISVKTEIIGNGIVVVKVSVTMTSLDETLVVVTVT